MELSSADKELLLALYSTKDWVDLYVLHERFLLSPGQILSSSERFGKLGVLEADGLRARLTSRGRRWVVEHRNVLLQSGRDRSWTSPSLRPILSRKSAAEPYLPDLRRIDFNFFKNR